MKKALIALSAMLLLAGTATAQESANRDRLDRIAQLPLKDAKQKEKAAKEFKTFHVELLPEIGYGSHFISSPDFQGKPWNSGEYYLHALGIYLRPVRALSLYVAAGISTEQFQTRTSVFDLDADKNIIVRKMTEAEAVDKRNRSSISMGTVKLPVALQIHAGDWVIRAGAEALYSFSPRVSTDLYMGDVRTLTETKGARITPWSYDYLASLSWSGLGLYAKYQPASARRFPEPGPAFSTWTFGIALSY